MICPNCGKQMPEGMAFCDNCGTRLPLPQDSPCSSAQQQPYSQPPFQPQSFQPQSFQPQPAQKKFPVAAAVGAAAVALAAAAVILFVKPGILKDRTASSGASSAQNSEVPTFTYQSPGASSGTARGGSSQPTSPQAGSSLLTLPGGDTGNTQGTASGTASSSGTAGVQPGSSPAAQSPSGVSQSAPAQSTSSPTDSASSSSGQAGINALSEAEALKQAAAVSTSERGGVMEFEWFLDLILLNGETYGEMFANAENITNLPYLTGGWKAYMHGVPGVYNSEVERYLNAEISAPGGDRVAVTLNWKYLFDPNAGQSIEETGSQTFHGTWNSGTGTTTSNLGNVEFQRFVEINGRQYGICVMQWNSGEKDYIALTRP